MAEIPKMEIDISYNVTGGLMNEQGLFELLLQEINRAGSLRRFAKSAGLSAAFVSKVVNHQSPISPALAAVLGYERSLVFIKKSEASV